MEVNVKFRIFRGFVDATMKLLISIMIIYLYGRILENSTIISLIMLLMVLLSVIWVIQSLVSIDLGENDNKL